MGGRKDPEARRQYDAEYRAANREKIVDTVRWIKILQKFGLTKEAWHALLDSQGGRCAVCGSDSPGGRGQWHTDHCHKTNKVRGLLCAGCNRGIGLLKDDPNVLLAAAIYLELNSPE